MTRLVTYVSESHHYPVRNATDFKIDASNKKSTERMVFRNGLKMFNEMPKEVKCETNMTKFKRLLIKYVKEKFK